MAFPLLGAVWVFPDERFDPKYCVKEYGVFDPAMTRQFGCCKLHCTHMHHHRTHPLAPRGNPAASVALHLSTTHDTVSHTLEAKPPIAFAHLLLPPERVPSLASLALLASSHPTRSTLFDGLRPPTPSYALLRPTYVLTRPPTPSCPLSRSCSPPASPLSGNLDTNFPAMCGKWSCYAVFVFIVINFVLSFRGHMRTAGYTDMYTWRISTSIFDKVWSVALCMGGEREPYLFI